MLMLAQMPNWAISLMVVGFVVISLMMILVVLVQRPQGGGLSEAFGSNSGSGHSAFGAKTGDALTTLTIGVFVAFIARMTRTSVLEVLGEDYIRTARAKGQTERKVLMRHALRNAAVPIVTVIGLSFAILIGGVVVTESVFTIPGLGLLTVEAVLARDYPTIQAVILLFSLVYVVINLLIDLSYTILDPRIRY